MLLVHKHDLVSAWTSKNSDSIRPVEDYRDSDQLRQIVLSQFRRDLTTLIGSAAIDRDRRVPEVPKPAYFAVQRDLIDDHSGRFVGRQRMIQAVDQFISTHDRGYLLFVGAPGQGKTALASHLIKKRAYAHHLIARTGGRNDPGLITRSILEQIGEQTAARSAANAELAKVFENALVKNSDAGTPVVVVVDGLEELSVQSEDPPMFLMTQGLPPGVYYVLTCTPGQAVDRLHHQFGKRPAQIVELPPLNRAEMEAMAQAALSGLREAQLEDLIEVTGGNALYLQILLSELERDAAYDIHRQSPRMEDYFRGLANVARQDGTVRTVLGLLAVARKPLTVKALAEITGERQRTIYDDGLGPVHPALLDAGGAYELLPSFRRIVLSDLLFEDELRASHRALADWLDRVDASDPEYRWGSLSKHLFESENRARLVELSEGSFLMEKVRQYGYAVLEDIELVARSLLDTGDPGVVGRCVDLVESLRGTIGDKFVADSIAALRFPVPGYRPQRGRITTAAVPHVPGTDVFVGMLPQEGATADFIEVIPFDRRLFIVIGDVPGRGLKSAFVARFLANLVRRLVRSSVTMTPGGILTAVDGFVREHDYFPRLTMQCVELDPGSGVARMADAGHPFPVLYTASRQRCDQLPIRGPAIREPLLDFAPRAYDDRTVEIDSGDVLVVISDGLTEGHSLEEEAFSYRFTQTVERLATGSARRIGREILAQWLAHPREHDWSDDASLVVVAIVPAESSDCGDSGA